MNDYQSNVYTISSMLLIKFWFFLKKKWKEMFPFMISKAATMYVIFNGENGNINGSAQLVSFSINIYSLVHHAGKWKLKTMIINIGFVFRCLQSFKWSHQWYQREKSILFGIARNWATIDGPFLMCPLMKLKII